jgi:hypothetical protein
MKLYIRRERPDSSTPLFDFATPAEIMAKHPKCNTCKYWHYDESDHSGDVGFCRLIDNEVCVNDYCNKWESKP